MDAYFTQMVLEQPEILAFIEHEVSCPFCESNAMCIIHEDDGSYYKCGVCANDWTVAGVEA